MDTPHIILSLAVAWFTYHVFRMMMRIYQFYTFPKTFGYTPKFSLKELAETSINLHTDLPSFKVVVPAYQEVEVIEGTLRRLAKINYPRTHYEVYVVTYEDEPRVTGSETTSEVVQRVAKSINSTATVNLVKSLVTPEGYDGYFPGDLTAGVSHIGKGRGLNYALRRIHEEIELDERTYYIGKMANSGHLKEARKVIKKLVKVTQNPVKFDDYVDRFFIRSSETYIGPLVFSSQLMELLDVANEIKRINSLDYTKTQLFIAYIRNEASRFYYHIASGQSQSPYKVQVLPKKGFLQQIMFNVEAKLVDELCELATDKEKQLQRTRPMLYKRLLQASTGEEIYQLAKMQHSRWFMVYDADADAPVDLMRYLAGRILIEPSVMGFQGPVAPMLNYEEVHPICKLGGLWMGFWHGASYPRLMNKKLWSHPLAGTNWCFRIDGFEQEGRLIRERPYDESRRRFLLSFDPKQLTEDLEAGVRVYTDWAVNAEWHPVVEMEQVPPNARALFTQHTRWALGTLQTLAYITKSGIPLSQKTWYVLHPAGVMLSSTGPVVTVLLLIALFMGLLVVEPVFAWWTLVLTLGNFVYVWAFILTYERYHGIRERASSMEYIYQHGDEIVQCISSGIHSFAPRDKKALGQIISHLEGGLLADGFIQKYLSSRYLDDDVESDKINATLNEFVQKLVAESPYLVKTKYIHSFIAKLKQISLDVRQKPQDIQPSNQQPAEEIQKLEAAVNNCIIGLGSLRGFDWRRDHTTIMLWTFPYIYFQLTPFFKGLWLWLTGSKGDWNKTSRTPKKKDH